MIPTNQNTVLLSVLTQTNNYDCGVHVCRYVVNLVRMVNSISVKMTDVLNNFSNSITGHELFDYAESDINSMRTEVYNVMAHITNCYKKHRIHEHGSENDPMSDSDEDEDEVEIVDSQDTDDSDVVMVDAESTEDASYYFQSDDDDDLSFDTAGKCSVGSKILILIYPIKVNLT